MGRVAHEERTAAAVALGDLCARGAIGAEEVLRTELVRPVGSSHVNVDPAAVVGCVGEAVLAANVELGCEQQRLEPVLAEVAQRRRG